MVVGGGEGEIRGVAAPTDSDFGDNDGGNNGNGDFHHSGMERSGVI